jgi:hypothetical protein
LWAAKNRVATDFIGKGNAVPALVSYVATFVMSFLFPLVRRARLEDLFVDEDSLPKSLARLLDLPPREFEKWWTKTDWVRQLPKSYSDWTEGHRSAFLPPVFTDTQVELAEHPFWNVILPIFEKYYSDIDGSFPAAEVNLDLDALNAAWENYTMTLDEGYETFSSFKIRKLIWREDGGIDAKAWEGAIKDRGSSWREIDSPSY